MEKNKDDVVRSQLSKMKEENYKDTSIDDLYDSFHITNTSSPKQKEYKKKNGVSPREKNSKTKELKDYNERLQLDLTTMKSIENSVSSNKTFDINSSYENSTNGSNTANSFQNLESRTLSFKDSPIDNTPEADMRNDKKFFDHSVSTEDNLEVKGASVFDMKVD